MQTRINFVRKSTAVKFIPIILGTIFSVLLGGCSGNSTESGRKYYSYKSVINAFSDGLTKADGDILEDCMFTSEMKENSGSEAFSDMESTLKASNEMIEAIYEKKPKYKFKIEEKSELDQDEINSRQYYYSYYFSVDEKIEKAYQIEAVMKVAGQEDTVFFDVVKFEDNGWKIYPEAFKSMFSVNSFTGGGGFDY